MKRIVSVIAAVLISAPVFAQDKPATPAAAPAAAPATAPAAATPGVDVPKHSCNKPEWPGRLASNEKAKQFRKGMDDYRNCLVAFNDRMKKESEARIQAANAAVSEYNDYIKQLNAEQDGEDAKKTEKK